MIVEELTVAYEDEGSGSVALFLHGWGADHRNLEPLISAFAGYRILSLDLPGFGGSEVPPETWDVHDYSEFVEKCMEKLGVAGKVDVVLGHSFGGRIGLELMADHQDFAKKLILLASHGLPEPRTARSVVSSMLAKSGKAATFFLPENLKSKLRRKLYSFAGSNDYLQSGVMRETFLEVIKQDVSALAPSIKTPTLLLYGENDTTTPPALGEQLAELIPESKLIVIPDAGHYLHLDQPQKVIRYITDWLK